MSEELDISDFDLVTSSGIVFVSSLVSIGVREIRFSIISSISIPPKHIATSPWFSVSSSEKVNFWSPIFL